MQMIDQSFADLSLRAQFSLLNLNRSSYYYQKTEKSQEDLEIANKITELWLKYPFFGYRKINAVLRKEGFVINHKKVQRFMKEMNLSAIFPKYNKNKWKKADYDAKYPYLLKDLQINKVNQVWASDITYIRMNEGFTYFLAIIDLYSRFILSAYLSTTLEADFCIETLQIALNKYQKPEIFNTDQGSQFTSFNWCDLLKEKDIKISHDGKGRCFDNIINERLWRTVKYEEVYLKSYESVNEARINLMNFVEFYNYQRPHQSLRYKTPAEIYFENGKSS
jgi:putative transposase